MFGTVKLPLPPESAYNDSPARTSRHRLEGNPKPSKATVTIEFAELFSACSVAVFAPVDVGLKATVTGTELFAE